MPIFESLCVLQIVLFKKQFKLSSKQMKKSMGFSLLLYLCYIEFHSQINSFKFKIKWDPPVWYLQSLTDSTLL